MENIQVICDDQQHSKGKIAKIELFKHEGEKWEAQYAPPGDDGYQPSLKCKLCRFNLSARKEHLQRSLDLVASKGLSEVTLRFLAAINANKRLR